MLTLPPVPTRSLDAYKINTGTNTADRRRGSDEPGDRPRRRCCRPISTAGLKRLKIAAMRRLAPELLITAKTQRWSPEEFLRTLVEAEIAARDASNAATRRRQAQFPVPKTLDEFDLTVSSMPAGHVRLPRLAGMDPGGGERLPDRPRRHRQVPPAARPRLSRRRRRPPGPLPHRRRPRRHPLPGFGRQLRRHVIDNLLRNDLIIIDELGFAPLDDTAAQLLFRFVAAAYERRSLGIGSHWPFESWGRFLPEHTTAVSLLDRLLHHCHTVVTDGESYRMRQARQRGGTKINKP